MNNANNGIAIVNEEMSALSDAKIPLTDRGFLFGHAVFETLLVKDDKIIAWENHMQRLELSCKKSYIKFPSKDYLKDLSLKAIVENNKNTKNKGTKTSLRIIITGGFSINLPITKNIEDLPNCNIIIICRNAQGPTEEQYMSGIKLKSILDVRPKELIDIKSCNYLFSIMSLQEARDDGFDDVLFYDKNNKYTESSTANFIWFDENYTVYSTPLKNNCLPGTTLLLFTNAIRNTEIKFKWKILKNKELKLIYGCAIMSSTRLILPVCQIDNIKFKVKEQNLFFKKLNNILEKKLEI